MTTRIHEDHETTTPIRRGAILGAALVAASLLAACGGASETGSDTGGAGGIGGMGGMGGAGSMEGWSCLGSIDAPTYVDGPDVDGSSTVTDLLADTPIVGATLTVCAATDTDCANPMSTGNTDAIGTAALSMGTSEGFYIEFSANGYPDHVAFGNGPPSDGWGLNFVPLDSAGLVQLVGLLGGTPDPTRGHVGVAVVDCSGEAAPGVIIEIDTADAVTMTGYFASVGVPNTSLTETSTDGRVGIANLPVGPYIVTAKVAETGEVISTRRGFVRAGAISYPGQVNPAPQVAP
jgi:hypothetical protein